MKGLRLHVRWTSPDDGAQILAFYEAEGAEPPPTLDGVVGKLLGSIVAHASLSAAGTAERSEKTTEDLAAGTAAVRPAGRRRSEEATEHPAAGTATTRPARRRRSEEALELHSLFVARDLRRKRIGRVMIGEIALLAAGENFPRIVASNDCAIAPYLLREGFEARGGILERIVKGSEGT